MFPYIEVKGTHREIGQAIGEELRSDIRRALKIEAKKRKKPDPKVVGSLIKTVLKYFPDYLEEVAGIAEGSGASFLDLLFYSFEEELDPTDRCTTLAVRSGKNILFGHNEDWDLNLPYYIVKAKPRGKPKFLSLGQAGQFPCRLGMNEYGLAFSDNSVDTKLNQNGLPKNYLLRKFFECKSISETRRVISQKERAIGGNSVVVSYNESKIATLEWSPRSFVLKEFKKGVAHANHFIFPENIKFQSHAASKGSRRRFLSAEEQVLRRDDFTVGSLKEVLKTHTNKEPNSICNHSPYRTRTSVIMDMEKKAMYVADGNPCTHDYKKFVLS